MNAKPLETPAWYDRVLELLDDPVGRAVLRGDGLSRDDVIGIMAAAAANLDHRKHPDIAAAA